MATTVEELRAESPELVSELEAAVRADATRAEQERLQGIDNIAGLFSADMVREAKYGKTACTAQELAFRAAQEAAKNGQTFLANLEADAQASGAGEVPAAPASTVGMESGANIPGARCMARWPTYSVRPSALAAICNGSSSSTSSAKPFSKASLPVM